MLSPFFATAHQPKRTDMAINKNAFEKRRKEIEKKREEMRVKKQHDEECKEVCSFKPKIN